MKDGHRLDGIAGESEKSVKWSDAGVEGVAEVRGG